VGRALVGGVVRIGGRLVDEPGRTRSRNRSAALRGGGVSRAGTGGRVAGVTGAVGLSVLEGVVERGADELGRDGVLRVIDGAGRLVDAVGREDGRENGGNDRDELDAEGREKLGVGRDDVPRVIVGVERDGGREIDGVGRDGALRVVDGVGRGEGRENEGVGLDDDPREDELRDGGLLGLDGPRETDGRPLDRDPLGGRASTRSAKTKPAIETTSSNPWRVVIILSPVCPPVSDSGVSRRKRCNRCSAIVENLDPTQLRRRNLLARHHLGRARCGGYALLVHQPNPIVVVRSTAFLSD